MTRHLTVVIHSQIITHNKRKQCTNYIYTLCPKNKFTLFISAITFPTVNQFKYFAETYLVRFGTNRHMAILTFVGYVSLIYIVKWHPLFFQFHNITILILHFRQFFRWWYCDRNCFVQSLNHYNISVINFRFRFIEFHVMIDRSFSLVNYRTPTAWQQMTLSRKHRFQRQRSNFDRKFVRF